MANCIVDDFDRGAESTGATGQHCALVKMALCLCEWNKYIKSLKFLGEIKH